MMELPEDIAAAKALLRTRALALRREARLAAGPAADEALARFADTLAAPAGASVAGFWPIGDEIDPRPLMKALADAGRDLCLPLVTAPGRALAFRRWMPGEALEAGPHGTRHPPASSPAARPSLVLVPLLAFDRRGFRLGYGGGYYDRTLDLLRQDTQVKAVGLAFAAQEVDRVPEDMYDQRLDAVLTEAGPIALETR